MKTAILILCLVLLSACSRQYGKIYKTGAEISIVNGSYIKSDFGYTKFIIKNNGILIASNGCTGEQEIITAPSAFVEIVDEETLISVFVTDGDDVLQSYSLYCLEVNGVSFLIEPDLVNCYCRESKIEENVKSFKNKLMKMDESDIIGEIMSYVYLKKKAVDSQDETNNDASK